MNRLYKYSWLLILILSVSFSFCKKYLDVKSDKSLVVPTSLYDLQALLDNDLIMNNKAPAFSQACVDDIFLTTEKFNAQPEFHRQVYIWQIPPYSSGNDWGAAYNAVYYANYCMEQLDEIPKNGTTMSEWSNIKGSAHFYRGYYFLWLLWEYAKSYDSATADADLGIVLRLNSDFNIPSVRSSVRESYKQVIEDLMEASYYLPVVSLHPSRPSKPAAYGALSRCYLSMNQYDSAYKYANLCLEFKSDLLDYNSTEVNKVSTTPFQRFNKEIVFYTAQSANYAIKLSRNSFQDTALYDTYAPDDLRKICFFFKNGNYYSFKGHYTSNLNLFFNGISTSEILLIRSEANARMGRVSEAMNDLNHLLIHRWVSGSFIPLTAESQEEALNIVLLERRKELTMRGLRWMDIKRLNRLGSEINLIRILDGQEYKMPPNDNRFALPLPDDVIRLTGMPQN
ncbi:RagB/SusD family nutrient uptake outer membrane protein [Flavihumibacter sp. UBA7668]|uniref:RagB/SusD family nutrient uptake outer membrane protein n=1 Tax=Flavihumibacter sp. UBA7668 TaxID=1946542 RepID=UPI0025C5F5B5|nr:RagB/SusD family nutrient uptake outer membrane protein [Flavihumibacter sp. UBA7668]